MARQKLAVEIGGASFAADDTVQGHRLESSVVLTLEHKAGPDLTQGQQARRATAEPPPQGAGTCPPTGLLEIFIELLIALLRDLVIKPLLHRFLPSDAPRPGTVCPGDTAAGHHVARRVPADDGIARQTDLLPTVAFCVGRVGQSPHHRSFMAVGWAKVSAPLSD
jgi:hypothetical protein